MTGRVRNRRCPDCTREVWDGELFYSYKLGRLSGDCPTVWPCKAFSEARASAAEREIAGMVLKGFGLDVQILMREGQVSWLKDVLDSAEDDDLCVSLYCTTLGSDAFEHLLKRAAEQAGLGGNASSDEAGGRAVGRALCMEMLEEAHAP